MSDQAYETQDAELAGFTKEEYRSLLEAVLAGHVEAEAEAREREPGHAPYLRGEINGLCTALRLLGGYEGVAFYLEWARAVPPAAFDWRAFFGYPREGGRVDWEGLVNHLFCPIWQEPEELDLTPSQRRRLELALGRLSDREAETLRLRYPRTRTYAQIGKLYGVSVSRARQLWARALSRLRRDTGALEVAGELGLQPRGVGPS